MDNEKTEDLVQTPETERNAARNLMAAANSDNSLEGYAAINSDAKAEIAKLAKKFASAQGKQEGPDQDDWFRAEQEVRRRLRGVDGL
jgi:hypothetical protein